MDFMLTFISLISTWSLANGNLLGHQGHADIQMHFMVIGASSSECVTGQTEMEIHTNNIVQQLNIKSNATKIEVEYIPDYDDNSITRLHVAAEISRYSINSQVCPGDSISQSANFNSTLIGVISFTKTVYEDMTNLWPDVSVPIIFLGETNLPAALPSNVFDASVQLSQRAKAIAELAAKLNFDYISVAHNSDSTSKELKNLLEKELRDHFVCVEEYIEISGDDETGTVDKIIKKDKTKATIFVSMAKTTTINLLNNDDESMHWIIATQADISIEANYQKDKVYVVRHNNDSQNPHVSKLESVLQLQSETAREILKTQCGNDIRRCSDLQLSVLNSLKLMKAEYLQNTSSYREAYNATPTALLPEPSVFYVSQSLQSLYTASGGWDFNATSNSDPGSWCTDVHCRAMCAKQINKRNYVYLPGDYIFIVTAPIFDRHNDYPDLLTCVDFDKEGTNTLRSEAVIFARKRLNEIFGEKGLNIGLLIFDTCFNSALAQKTLIDILYGTRDYCNKYGDCLDRSKIVGLVGDYSSHITYQMQPLLMPAHLIQVSYGASTSKLDDKVSTNTHFLRVQPSFSKLAKNVHQFVQFLEDSGKAKINSYVLISTNSEYGANGAKNIKQELKSLKQHDLCLLKEYELDYSKNDTVAYDNLWHNMSNLGSGSYFVIFIGEEKTLENLLDRLKFGAQRYWRDWWIHSGNTLLILEVFDESPAIKEKYGDLLRGSFVASMTLPLQVPRFIEHLQGLRAKGKFLDNLWFTRMYQEKRQCKIRGFYVTPYNVPCLESEGYSPYGVYKAENYAVLAIQALYAFVYGFHSYALEICKGNYTCPLLYNRSEHLSQLLKNHIKNVKLPNSDAEDSLEPGVLSVEPFNSNYDGRHGHDLFIIQPKHTTSSNDVKYEKIAQFISSYNHSEPDTITSVTLNFKFRKGVAEIYQFDGMHCGHNTCSYGCTSSTLPLEIPTDEPEKNLFPIALGVPLSMFIIVTGILLAVVLRQRLKKYDKTTERRMEMFLQTNGPKEDEVSTQSTSISGPEANELGNENSAFSADNIAETQMQNLPTAEDCTSTPAVACVQPESGWRASHIPSYHYGRFNDCSQSLTYNNLSCNIRPESAADGYTKIEPLKEYTSEPKTSQENVAGAASNYDSINTSEKVEPPEVYFEELKPQDCGSQKEENSEAGNFLMHAPVPAPRFTFSNSTSCSTSLHRNSTSCST